MITSETVDLTNTEICADDVGPEQEIPVGHEIHRLANPMLTDQTFEISGDDRVDPEIVVQRQELREVLNEALASLTKREAQIVLRRTHEEEYKDIAATFSISSQYTQRIERRAMNKLRSFGVAWRENRLSQFKDLSLK